MVPDILSVTEKFWSFWLIFCPLPPTNKPKTQNFEKMRKTTGDIIILNKCTVNEKPSHGDIIILHKCTKNHDHML